MTQIFIKKLVVHMKWISTIEGHSIKIRVFSSSTPLKYEQSDNNSLG